MIVNNRETVEGERVNYVDQDGHIHDATLTSLAEENGNCFAEVEYLKDGQITRVTWVPHNTSTEKHSWDHAVI